LISIDGCEGLESRDEESQSHGAEGSKTESEALAHEEGRNTPAAWEQSRALTTQLMEQVCHPDNLNRAYLRVKRNKGSSGIDGMNIEQLAPWLKDHKEEIIASLLDGSYRPKAVRGVEIPKADGGVRKLGIPTVVDRLAQQAILQVLEPILDPTFSDSSYGFRAKRSAHQALKQAQEYVKEGRYIVVDIDLEKFFDRVNHDMLMARLARWIGDKRLLRIVRRFLQAGMMSDGICVARHEGTPQGGPLSPILANLLLDDLDKELEKRGHCFCRYADDCNIYVKTEEAGKRVMDSITQFIERKLKLKVNREKSAVAPGSERKFLGHRLLSGGRLGIAPKSLKRAKKKVREITKRNRGVSLEQVVLELNSFLNGWVVYYRHAAMKGHLTKMDEWLRRKLRCHRLKQRKRSYSIVQWLIQLGVPSERAWTSGKSSKGWWRLSGSPAVAEAMNGVWFKDLGLINLTQRWEALQL
jgi:RNA-directed DNA polymerase